MVLHIISYKIITNVRIYTNFFPACLRHLVQWLKWCFRVIACQKICFSTAENTWMSTFVFNIIVLVWLENNGLLVIFLIYHFWFQLISIGIHIRAILDFQDNLNFQETRQTISCHLWKNPDFFIKRAVFPVKSKLWKPFWPQSDGVNLEKVNSFILGQIRIIEFCFIVLWSLSKTHLS